MNHTIQTYRTHVHCAARRFLRATRLNAECVERDSVFHAMANTPMNAQSSSGTKLQGLEVIGWFPNVNIVDGEKPDIVALIVGGGFVVFV